MTEQQIKYMRDRFLRWTLPEDLNPDGGISFKRSDSAVRFNHPMPVGTNFLNADQAEAMVRHMVEGMPNAEFRTKELPNMQTVMALAKNHPMMKVWNEFCDTDEFKSALRWAVEMKYDDGRPVDPIQREQHAKGAMWLAFTKGMEVR